MVLAGRKARWLAESNFLQQRPDPSPHQSVAERNGRPSVHPDRLLCAPPVHIVRQPPTSTQTAVQPSRHSRLSPSLRRSTLLAHRVQSDHPRRRRTVCAATLGGRRWTPCASFTAHRSVSVPDRHGPHGCHVQCSTKNFLPTRIPCSDIPARFPGLASSIKLLVCFTTYGNHLGEWYFGGSHFFLLTWAGKKTSFSQVPKRLFSFFVSEGKVFLLRGMCKFVQFHIYHLHLPVFFGTRKSPPKN